jgi:hypothetical protein
MIVRNAPRAGSQVLRLSTLAALVYTLLVLHACSDSNFLQPPPPQKCDTSSATAALLPPGSYFLANVDGTGLPIVFTNPTKVLASGRIDLTADSAFSIVQLFAHHERGHRVRSRTRRPFRGHSRGAVRR